MTKMELGQSSHDEFWTIGLNAHRNDCRLPKSALCWKTFYPLADTRLLQPQSRPKMAKFTTIGQWYWSGAVEVAGEFPHLFPRGRFGSDLRFPVTITGAQLQIAMYI